MKERRVGQHLLSSQAVDGAGVRLRRIFWREDTLNIDPFLMLDTFDSSQSSDYIKGFPFHPHRGIETFTYVIEGSIMHRDSLGNKGKIKDGEYQWMNAGSGILHEEMPEERPRMLAMQLWINLPQKEKMSPPHYLEGTNDNIPEVKGEGYKVRVLSGTFRDKSKLDLPGKIPVEIYDIALEPNTTLTFPVREDYNSFATTFLGTATISDHFMEEKSAATFVEGDQVTIVSGNEGARIFFFGGKPLNEPVAWGGSIVMNTQEELAVANKELQDGSFIKHKTNL